MKESKIELKEKPDILYDVKIDCTIPAILEYRVLAKSPEEAMEKIKSIQPKINYKVNLKKETKLTVYLAGTTMISFMKNLFGRR